MASKTQRIRARLRAKETQLENAYSTFERLLAEDVERYRFDSGDGSQLARRRNLDELRRQISTLENEIDALYNRLNRQGLTTVTLRRKNRF